MQSQVVLLKFAVFLFVALALQVHNGNAKPLVKFQGDSLNLKTGPTEGIATTVFIYPSEKPYSNQVTTSQINKITSPTDVQPSENTLTDYVSTQESEEIISPTVGSMPTTQEPPCWKKTKEIMAFLDMYAMLGFPQDFSPPECDSEGYYKPLQCHFAGCQCVDRDGTPTSEFSSEFGTLVCPQTRAILNDLPSQ